MQYTDEVYYFDQDNDGFFDYDVSDPDFNVQYFISNLVLRWEYTPGSTLFVVWSQGREGYTPQGDFSFNQDMRDLFAVHPHNVFLIKLNYWLSI
ncbi:DUF5916 domain-containing protein [candidate division CSSED10-310 bacterium]|uniref:DUF5916 domain-containing protein n=1 Tax=candidate division CSSED10-310 bacterium TaxID=2855610 RepID=A0ABV6YZL6_UNCC1